MATKNYPTTCSVDGSHFCWTVMLSSLSLQQNLYNDSFGQILDMISKQTTVRIRISRHHSHKKSNDYILLCNMHSVLLPNVLLTK